MPINFVNTIISRVKINGAPLKKITIDGSSVFETSLTHSYKEVERVEATCAGTGWIKSVCEWCGEESIRVLSARGHLYGDWTVTDEPTCTKTGKRIRYCTRSGCTAYEEETVAKIEHSYTSEVTPPTCVEKGYTTHTCTECGHSYVDSYTETTDHEYEDHVVVSATCTQGGTATRKCTNCGHSLTVYPTSALGHSWGDWSVTLEPTCMTTGTKRHDCTRAGCTAYEEEQIAACHTYGDLVTTKEPTDTETGLGYKECTVCGYKQTVIIDKDLSYTENEDGNLSVGGSGTSTSSTVTIPDEVNGKNVNAVNGKAFFSSPIVAVHFSPGIERIGASAFENCIMLKETYLPGSITTIEPLAFAGCDNATIYCEAESKPEGWDDGWVDDSVTVVWGHTHTNRIISVLPTCTDKGYNLATCEVCGYKQQSNITPALGHNWNDATCTKPKTCTVCGETEGEALGHTEVSISPVPPTCTEAGLTEGKKCSVCGEITFAPIPFPATGHTWSAWEETKSATCTTEGEEKRTCSVCGATETRTVEATGHDYYELEVKEPTCTQSGYTVYMCSRCGDQYTDHEVEATGEHIHPDDNWEILSEPTCEEEGYKINKCTTCVDSLGIHTLEEFIPATGHTWGAWITETDPTCTTVGSRKHTCSVCGAVETEEIPIDATEHNFGDWETVIPATCEVDGQEERKCTRCGETESRSYPSTGHNWSDWNIDIEPTCTEKGSKTCTCTNCDTLKSEDIAALGHDYVIRPVEPTCTEQGYTSNTCSRCGDTFNGAYVDALGHSYVDTVTAPTCTEKGYTTHKCSRCGHSYVDTYVGALGHTPSDWIIDKQPTVEAEGSKHKECTVCGTVLETATIDNSIYLVTESGEFLTDEQGNLLIL